jgi:hypothetical protein
MDECPSGGGISRLLYADDIGRTGMGKHQGGPMAAPTDEPWRMSPVGPFSPFAALSR